MKDKEQVKILVNGELLGETETKQEIRKSSENKTLDLKNLIVGFEIQNKDELDKICSLITELVERLENLQINVNLTSIRKITDLQHDPEQLR